MRWCSIFLLVLLPVAKAQQPVSADLLSDPFLESYQPEVSVSGNVIVGVMTTSAAAALAADAISVTSAAGSRLCLRVASRDGIYTSRNAYSIPADASGAAKLPYASRLSDVVSAFGPDEVAAAATDGDCDNSSNHYYLVAGAQPGAAVIYVNSFGATDVFTDIDGNIEACEFISEGRRTTYDFACRLGEISSDNAIPVTIIRERFGREQPAVELTILGTTGG